MSRFNKTKRATSRLDYTFDWIQEEWLEENEEIVYSNWTATTGITVTTSSFTTTTTTVWVSGGTQGETYKLTNTIKTNNSPFRQDSRELFITIV